MKDANISVCGSDCGQCDLKEQCKGCNASEGKVFYLPEGSVCAIYDCTVNHKKKKNCGECSQVPCEIWQRTRDPKYSDEEFAQNIQSRMQTLRKS